MSELVEMFGLVLPLLGIAGLGWIAARFFGFTEDAQAVLSHYVLWLAGPAALIVAVADSRLGDLLDAQLVGASFLTYVVVFAGILAMYRVSLRRELGESAFAAFSVAKFNLIIIGLPVVFSIVGIKSAPAVVINAFLSYFFLTSLTLFLYGLSQKSKGQELGAATVFLGGLRQTLTNPLILGSLLGLGLLLFEVHLPKTVRTPLTALGNSVVPVGLIAVGMSMRDVQPKNWSMEIWLMALAKMVVAPGVAIGFALLLELEPAAANSMVILFGVPSAVVTYVLAREYGVYARQSSEIVVLTTLLGAIVIPLNALLCRIIWPLPSP